MFVGLLLSHTGKLRPCVSNCIIFLWTEGGEYGFRCEHFDTHVAASICVDFVSLDIWRMKYDIW